MKDGLFINGNRSGYAPDQIEDRTMTIRELIERLEEMSLAYGDDTKVFLINDNGYTYGEFQYEDIDYGTYNDDGEVNFEC